MKGEDIKDIIIALIDKGLFSIGDTNEETAIEVAKFENAYWEESQKE